MTLTRSTATPPANGKTSQVFLSAGLTWTDQPAALTELNAATTARQRFDLTNFSHARLSVNVATVGFAGATLRVQYSVDNGSTWAYLDGTSGPSSLLTTAGTITDGWVKIADAAKGDVLLRVAGIAGNAVADPVFGTIALQLAAA